MDIIKQIKKLAEEQKTREIEALLVKTENEKDYINAVLLQGQAYISRGIESGDMKWFNAAENSLIRIRDNAMDRGIWNFLMSVAALYQFRFEEAFVYAQQGAAFEADHTPIYLQLAKTLYWLGNEERALKAAKKGGEIDPKNEEFAILIKQIAENASPADVIAPDFADYLETGGKPTKISSPEIEHRRIILFKKTENGKLLYAECYKEDGYAIIRTGTKDEEGKMEKVALKKDGYHLFLRDFTESCKMLGYSENPEEKNALHNIKLI